MANWWDSLPQATPLDAAIQQEGLAPDLAALAQSVYAQESSGGRNTATSSAGAVGGMQILPGTFSGVADKGWDINNPVDNARAGVRYLRQMYEKGGNDPRLAAIGYYGGPGAIAAAQRGESRSDPRNPSAPNTFQYADQVMGRIRPQASAQQQATGDEWWSNYPVVESEARPATGAPMSISIAHEDPQAPGDASEGGVLGGVLMGIRDPIDAGAQLLRRAVPDSVGNAIDSAGNFLADLGLQGRLLSRSDGATGVDALVNQANSDYQRDREAAGRDGFDFARLGGNLIGGAPVLATGGAALPIAGRIGVGAAQGAALGALNPVLGEDQRGDFWSEKGKQVGLGALLGGVTPAITGGLARVISPNASQAGGASQLLRREGVELTPGQILGGNAMRVEDRLMSAPIMGDAIRGARGRANEQLNRAVYNRVLEPIGQRTDKIGRAAVEDATSKVSQAYDDVLSKVSFRADRSFRRDLSQISRMAQELPETEAQQFARLLQREVLGPMAKGRGIDGRAFKQIESNLGEKAQGFLKSPDAYQKELGRALLEVQSSLRDNLVRLNPQAATELQAVNRSFAQLVRLQTASGSAGAVDGVFTPAQLAAAVRNSDKTVRRNSYAQGRALMQDLSDAARSAMNSQIPNSGTADRMLLNIGALGTGAYNPLIPAGLAAGSVPYLPGVIRGAGALVGSRPSGAAALANQVRALPPGALGVLSE